MDWFPQLLATVLIVGGVAFLFRRRSDERARNAPLTAEIRAHVCFETSLYRASVLGTGGFGQFRGQSIPVRGPKRLTVGTDAFVVSAPQALREFVFRGRESSIGFSQLPSRLVDADWIVITGQHRGRQVQIAIMCPNLPEAWQALAATGAVLAL